MALRVELTRAAARDLADARRWYSQSGSGPKAKAIVLRILQAIEVLGEQPRLWRGVGDGVQMAVVADHVILYRAGPEIVRVLRVLGPGRDRAG